MSAEAGLSAALAQWAGQAGSHSLLRLPPLTDRWTGHPSGAKNLHLNPTSATVSVQFWADHFPPLFLSLSRSIFYNQETYCSFAEH